MPLDTAIALSVRLRNLYFMRNPSLWEEWPFLPVMRRRPGAGEECGVLYDAQGKSGTPGYAATVFLENYFLLPPTEAEILKLLHYTYATPEDVFTAGWTLD
jgi:hypothetical protein